MKNVNLKKPLNSRAVLIGLVLFLFAAPVIAQTSIPIKFEQCAKMGQISYTISATGVYAPPTEVPNCNSQQLCNSQISGTIPAYCNTTICQEFYTALTMDPLCHACPNLPITVSVIVQPCDNVNGPATHFNFVLENSVGGQFYYYKSSAEPNYVVRYSTEINQGGVWVIKLY